MKYREQLSFIMSFIALRILTMVLYAFFRPTQSGPYTPYIIFLYSVFDILIIFFLYRYVKEIKRQHISLWAILIIVVTIIFEVLRDLYIFPLHTEGLSTHQIKYREIALTISPFLVRSVMEFVIAMQLIKNKTTNPIRFYLKLVGWSYLAVLFLALLTPFISMCIALNQLFTYQLPYTVLQLSFSLPLFAMIFLYLKELKHFNDISNEMDGPTIDGRL